MGATGAANQLRAEDDEVRQGAMQALIADRGPRSWVGIHPYAKWQGVFWRLLSLVDLDVDPAHPRIPRMVDSVLNWLTSDQRRARLRRATVNGRVRWCATQDGLGLWAATRLGWSGDPRTRLLAEALVAWQWPDGGWNCDKRPGAAHSSFHETHGSLRGLAAYQQVTGEANSHRAVQHAAEFLLSHRLYRSCRTGRVVHPEFVKLHWPPYWHYDVLVGLRALAAVDMLRHPNAADALDLLEAARSPGGTWRTSGRPHWRPPSSNGSNREVADLSQVACSVVTEQAARCLQQGGRRRT